MESATQLALPKPALAADRKLGAPLNIAFCFAVARLRFCRPSRPLVEVEHARHLSEFVQARGSWRAGPPKGGEAGGCHRIRFLLRRVTCAAPPPAPPRRSKSMALSCRRYTILAYHVKPTVKGQP